MAAPIEVDFPYELSEKLSEFRANLKTMQTVLEPICTASFSETREMLEPLERAKLDLVSAYALNSLFFMYLRTKGEDVQEHDIKKELKRIRFYMGRLKDIVDRPKASRVDVPAAKRFIGHALWTEKNKVASSEKRKIIDSCDGEIVCNLEVKSGAPTERQPKMKRK